MKAVDFNLAPFLAIWEVTRACALACRHCRASAIAWRDPRELTTAEGKALLRDTAAMGTPLFIFTGGDPVSRADLFDLIRYGRDVGLRTATIPAATDRLDRDLVVRLKAAGLDQMALSLDFPRPALHDTFRGVPGAYAKTLQAVEWAHEAGLPLQINTTVCGDTAPYLEEMADLVQRLGIVFWEVFFLVPVGRGSVMTGLTPAQCEKLFEVIYRVQKRGTFIVKVTEAPHYRRHVALREGRNGGYRPAVDGSQVQGFQSSVPSPPSSIADAGHPTVDFGPEPPVPRPSSPVPHPGMSKRIAMPELLTRSEGPGHTVGLAPRGVNAGKGFLFVSHIGDIQPSGFLTVSAGNVREDRVADVYRSSELFRLLREPGGFKGVCGRCPYRDICGGSRSRAYALTGDPFESDPWCACALNP